MYSLCTQGRSTSSKIGGNYIRVTSKFSEINVRNHRLNFSAALTEFFRVLKIECHAATRIRERRIVYASFGVQSVIIKRELSNFLANFRSQTAKNCNEISVQKISKKSKHCEVLPVNNFMLTNAANFSIKRNFVDINIGNSNFCTEVIRQSLDWTTLSTCKRRFYLLAILSIKTNHRFAGCPSWWQVLPYSMHNISQLAGQEKKINRRISGDETCIDAG